MRICFIGHKFHQKTRSNAFFLKFLNDIGEVEEFYSSPDEPGALDDNLIRQLSSSKFDCYVFWQTEYIAERLLPLGLGRFILVPMYDGAASRLASFWRQFVDAQFISFSRVHHEELQRCDCRTAYFQYFPEPVSTREYDFEGPLSAFFWERRPSHEPALQTVVKLCRRIGIDSLYLHAAPDHANGSFGRLNRPDTFVIDDVQVKTSRWFENRSDLDDLAEGAQFIFAPRPLEGIGMSFLEAMSRGQIVVAPDKPTMNEYIRHRTTGILYDINNPVLDHDVTPALLSAMSRAAVSKTHTGHVHWKLDQDRLKSLVLDDGRRWPTKDVSSHFRNTIRRRASTKARGQ